MADVITRFKLETTQYDSKLRDETKRLAEITRQASKAGNEFKNFTQKNVEAARALGNMTPSANNAKDKVKELVSAFNDAAKAYNALTKEQQQSDFGKALAQSISQLSDKVKEAKQELYGMGDAVKKAGGGGIFGGMGDKMSGALQVFAGNMMTKAAGVVANLGSEIADMVKQGVEMAKAGEGIRNAFERLGRGDILDGLRQATHGTVTDLELMKAAVKFNDFKLPVEELGTMLAFAQQKAKDTGQSVDYMVDSIVTGLGRKSLMILDNLGLSATEVKDKMKETGDMTKAVGEIIREQMAKAGDYVETAADRAAQANVSLQNKMEELGRKFAPIEEASNSLWTSMKIGILDVIDGPLLSLLNYLNQASRSAEDLLTKSLPEVGSNVDDKGNYIKRPAQKGAAGFDWEKGTWKPGYSGAVYNAATGQTELPEVLVTGTRRENPKKKPTKGVTKTPKTEEQLNNDEIQKLTQEYIKASDDRRKAIEGEIKTLQDRNKEIERLKDMALGKIGDDGSLPAMTQQLKELQNAQSESANGREWDDYQKKIEDVTAKINVLKGVLSKDQQATFTVEVNAEQLEQLRMLLPNSDDTVRVNVEEGRVNLPEIPKEDETIRVNITATTADAMKEVRDMVGEIEGWEVAIEPKIEIKEEDLRTPFEKLSDGLKIEIAEENMKVDTTTLQTLMKTAIQNGIDGLNPEFSTIQEKLREGINIPDETWQALQDEINEKLKELGIEPIKIDFKTGNIEKTGKETEKSWQAAAQAVQSVNSALQGLEEPGAKIMGIIGQAIAQIALGFAQATAADSKFGVFGWIAAITGGIATMTSTIAAIHSATGYANGGIVKGNSYSGDNIPAMIDGGAGGFAGLNAGEIVLNKSAQGNLASQLQDIEGRGGYTPSHISGEQIWIAINRYTKRTGRGELVTWK